MSNDIKGLERWTTETREFNRKAGRLRMKAGAGIIDAMEKWYSVWEEKRTPQSQREFQLWRLRLHLRFNDQPEFLMDLDEYFNIHLCDEEIGEPYWDIPVDRELNHRKPFNWRRDSGDAIRGREPRKPTKLDEESSLD